MGDTPPMSELPGLVAKGLQMTQERLDRSGGGIYASIHAQLTYIQQTLAANQKPAPEQVARLLLGVYAAREFETSDPEFADVLFAVEYLFKRV